LLLPAGEWDNWNTESTLFQTKASGDWVRTLLIPQGSWEYKFQIDGKWRVAPSDPVIHNSQVRQAAAGSWAEGVLQWPSHRDSKSWLKQWTGAAT
jgi:hypothetical protein